MMSPRMQPISRKLPLATGLSYHVLEWLPDDPTCDHTVVLIHGFLDLARGWQAMVDAGLAGRFHIVAPDMRGHGDSDRVGAGGYYYFMDYLADLHELVGQLGRTRVSLVGHSMGGAIAGYYTGTYPRRIHRLALLEGMGPPASPPMSAPERVARWIEDCRRARTRPSHTYASHAEAAARLRAGDPLLDEDLALALAQHGTEPTGDGRLRFKHDPLHLTRGPYPFLLEQSQALWRNITCPVLLVEATESWLPSQIPDLPERYACLAHARRVVIDRAGHMMQRHQPARLATTLRDFLAS
jgi:pimeloyl-ACP methyl ester carboxylesterase